MDRLKAPPRVAIVCRDVAGLSGTATTILEHCRRLKERGWSAHVWGERLDRSALQAAGAQARRLPRWPWGSYLRRRIFAGLADWAVSRGGYDLVHGHGDNFSSDVLSLHNCVEAASLAVRGEPLAKSSGVGRMHERILREQRFQLVIANSRLMEEELVGRYGVPQEKIRVIYPGHDPARFRAADRPRYRGSSRAELGLAETDVVFGLITSGDFAKRGVSLFLDALSLLRGRFPAVKALVVGKEGRLGPYLRQARAGGIAGAIKFFPVSPRVERYYHALDVYVHPALYEEFGQSVQEALACGLPVIAGARVGAVELMAAAAREFLLEKPDAAELAEKMRRLASDAALRSRLAALGQPGVQSNTWDRNFASTFACYQSLLSRAKKK